MSIISANQIKSTTGAARNVDSLLDSSQLSVGTGAGLVGYLPAGTGAVATTVQGKLRESVSVKDFGAVGDGVTDDTAAFNAAFTAAFTVIAPPGNYSVTTINVPMGCSLLGSGIANTTITGRTSSAVVSAVAIKPVS